MMRWKRILFRLALTLLAVWLILVAGLAVAMHQPPEMFGRIMAHVPGPLYLVLPFETFWNWSRGGHLHPGDLAPDFDLQTMDKTSRFHFAPDRQGRPVVLIFGSYT